MLYICIGVVGQKEYSEYKEWGWSVRNYNALHWLLLPLRAAEKISEQLTRKCGPLDFNRAAEKCMVPKKNTSLYLKNSAAYVSQPCTFTTGSGSECLIWLCPFSYQQQLLYYPSLAIGNLLVILCISIALKRTCNTSWQADNIKREQDEKMTNWQHHKRTRWQLSST